MYIVSENFKFPTRYITGLSQITDKISTMRTDATSKESNLKERISIINDKIKTEQKSATGIVQKMLE